jgi:hypothetical protein
MTSLWPRFRAHSLMIVVASFVLAACQPASVTTSSAGLPSETSSESSEATPTASETPAAQLQKDDVVATTVDGLRLRRAPGAEGELIGFLALGTVGFVMAEGVEIDGVPWYPLSGMGLPYASGCETSPPDEPISCPAWRGWVAGANAAGDPWLRKAADPPCPSPQPSIEEISETQDTLRLVCWSGQELSFRAWWPVVPDDAGLGGACPALELPAGWLVCQNINYNGLAANEAEGFVHRLSLSIDPSSDVTMPERGQYVDVTGHFDDPAASLCAEAAQVMDTEPILLVFDCRHQFVPTSVAVSSGG